MFEPDNSQTFVNARPEEVLDIYTSMNRPSIAPPDGRTPEIAQAFIASVYRDGLYHVHIFLHLTSSNNGLLFSWTEGGVSGENLNNLYQNSFEFAESMGFMMDNMRYREKSPEEKDEIHEQVPMFHSDLTRFESAGDEEVEELVIESLEGEDSDVELETLDGDDEDIDLSVLGDDDDEVMEITVGEDSGSDDAILGGSEEDDALGALEMEEPEEEEEEQLLDALEVTEELEAEPVDEADAAIDNILGESTLEGTTVSSPVIEPEPVAETEEAPLTPEEAEVLGSLDSPTEEAPPIAPAPAAPAPAPIAPPPAAATMAPSIPAASSDSPVSFDGGLTEDEIQALAKFLAMM